LFQLELETGLISLGRRRGGSALLIFWDCGKI